MRARSLLCATLALRTCRRLRTAPTRSSCQASGRRSRGGRQYQGTGHAGVHEVGDAVSRCAEAERVRCSASCSNRGHCRAKPSGQPPCANWLARRGISRGGTPPSTSPGTGSTGRTSDPDVLPLYEEMIVTGAWWDFVDEIASPARWSDPARRSWPMTPVTWATDEDLWRRRTAILCQLGARDAMDHDLLDGLPRAQPWRPRVLHSQGDRLGAPRLRLAQPRWVRSWVDRHASRLSPLSYREATKHL